MDGTLSTHDVVSEVMVVITAGGPTLALDRTGLGPLGLSELLLCQETVAAGAPSAARLDELAEIPEGIRARLDDLAAALADLPQPSSPRSISEAAPAADAPADEPSYDLHLVVPSPTVLLLDGAGFRHLDHAGNSTVTLTAIEVAAAAELRRPITVADAYAAHVRNTGDHALSEVAFAALAHRLLAVAAAQTIEPQTEGKGVASRTEREWRLAIGNLQRVGKATSQLYAEHLAADPTSAELTPIVGVHPHGPCPPLGIAMVIAYARSHEGERLTKSYDFFPHWLMGKADIPAYTAKPGIFLFSNYLWSVSHNLEIAAAIKAASPGSITVHGGPDTPKYDGDTERFFRDNPQVDIAVHGEGEVTFAELLAALEGLQLDDGQPDLEALRSVPGLSFRSGDETVRTGSRDRLTDIDSIPSPYLDGTLDAYAAATESTVIIETNRGCPYGCTFCDWGSATASRIRKFDLERVFDELEWCAKNGVARIWLADANFGIFERDVEIAEKVADLKRTHGYPKVFGTNYAKNTVKHLTPIVKVMADAGILTEGLLSLQSMDEGTLTTIRRSNIKTEKYDALAKEFRASSLPLYVDLMVGLPGSTLSSFRDDLQQCIDREVSARIFSTAMLTNSPMNEPSYREEHKIETELSPTGFGQRLVVSTATFTREDHDAMLKLREIYIMCENHGMLRQVSRFVRQERGIREVDLYEQMWRATLAEADRWPAMTFVWEAGPSMMIPPASWSLFIGELRTYLVEVLGLADDSALETVLRVQHGLLPARDRSFPDVLELPHDFGAWHQAMMDRKDGGDRANWPSLTPTLREFGPTHFPIDDPNQVCTLNMGYHVEGDIYSDWELRSPVARSLPATHLAT